MSFTFINGGKTYDYNGRTCEVTGASLRDSIKYTADSVNHYLSTGLWRVTGELTEFPRPGVDAKHEKNAKVHVVGKSVYGGKNTWIIETSNGLLTRAHASSLTEITSDDAKAFEISKDLGVNYATAMQMIKKGYGKL